MNQHQQEALQVEFAPLAGRIFVLSELSGPKYDIPDPAGGNIEDVREIALEIDQLLKQAMPCILEKLGVAVTPNTP